MRAEKFRRGGRAASGVQLCHQMDFEQNDIGFLSVNDSFLWSIEQAAQ